jgi:ABC-type amino acid transport substrate-binding protein
MRVMQAKHTWRETADALSVLGRRRIVFAAAPILILAALANTQESANVGALSGTLKKVKDTGTITLGYRENSLPLPFSYLNRRQQPIGYSIDLCREIVEDVSTELDGMEINITFAPVTPANRLQKLASGEIDLECGSTTGNVQRRKEVAFSPIFFVAPDIPTVGEFLPGYEASVWYGIGVPKDTPGEIVDTLNEAINAGLADATIKARLADLGGVPMPMSPAEFGKSDETEKWAKVVKFSGAKPN